MRWFAVVTLVLSPLCSCQSSDEKAASIRARSAGEQFKEISTSQLRDWMTAGEKFLLIDVREDNEWQAGHAATAMHISRWTLSSKIGTAVPDKTARIVLYCLGGSRSATGAETLQKIGYKNVFSLKGGFKNYQLAGLPIQR